MVDQGTARHERVILLPTWPPRSPELARRLVWSRAVPTAVTSLNQRLLAMSGRENLRVLDLFAAAQIRPGTKTYRDTLHLRPETYLRLTPLLLGGTRPP